MCLAQLSGTSSAIIVVHSNEGGGRWWRSQEGHKLNPGQQSQSFVQADSQSRFAVELMSGVEVTL